MGFVNSIFNFLHFKKRNWKAVVLCLFTATVFWFFNALNKSYSANITFPLAFEYDQEKYLPVKNLPDEIKVNVNGQGWDLFRKSLGIKVPPLLIPLEKPSEIKRIVGSTLPVLFSNQLTDLQINFVLADTIRIDLDERITKVIKLQADSIEQFIHPDFGLVNEVALIPDSIAVEGPRKIMAMLPNSLEVSLPRKNINKDYKDEVEIQFPHNEFIKRNPPVIQVRFSVEKVIDVSDRIPLKLMNVPLHVKPVVDVMEVGCTYRIPVSIVNSIEDDSLHATIDLNYIEKGKHTLSPKVVGLPQHARLVRVDSVRISY